MREVTGAHLERHSKGHGDHGGSTWHQHTHLLSALLQSDAYLSSPIDMTLQLCRVLETLSKYRHH